MRAFWPLESSSFVSRSPPLFCFPPPLSLSLSLFLTTFSLSAPLLALTPYPPHSLPPSPSFLSPSPPYPSPPCQLSARPTGFNRASIDAWELLQSTGMEAVVAYDLSGAVLLMGITLGALIAGTGAGVWMWYLDSQVAVMVTTMSIIMASALVRDGGRVGVLMRWQ